MLSLAGLYVDNKPPEGSGEPPVGGGEHPDNTLPGDLPHPEHPIVLPPNPQPGEEVEIKLKAVWSPDKGWETVIVIDPGSGATVPTPSR
jgi:hypothetical protein